MATPSEPGQADTSGAASPLLEVKGLCTEFATHAGTLRAVDDVSLSISAGEVFGIVGESGSGKSVTALSIMGLIRRPGRIVSGSVLLRDHADLLTKSPSQMRKTVVI